MYLLIFLPTTTVKAEISNQIRDFSYELVYPDNQKDKQLGYYDLLVEPGKKERLKLKVVNTSDKDLDLTISVNSAKTNGYGVIEYGSNDLVLDDSLNYDLSKLAHFPEEVTLKKNSSETIEFTIDTPLELFEGYIAGGIQIKPVEENSSEKVETNGIKNEFAFLIGVLLSQEKDIKNVPDIQINNLSVKRFNGSFSLILDTSNISPFYVEGLESNVEIKRHGDPDFVYKDKKSNMRMAPNTRMESQILIEDESINPDDYTATISQKSKDGGEWKWVKNISISKIKAEELNKQLDTDTPKKNQQVWPYLIAILLFSLFVILFIGYVFSTNKKKKSRRK